MGSRKLLAISALAVVGAAACVNGDATTGQVEDAMRNAGANDEQAICIGNQLGEELDQDQLNEVAGAAELSDLAGVDIAGSDEDLREFLRSVLARCMENESPETTSPEGDEPSSTEDSDAGESGGDGSDGE